MNTFTEVIEAWPDRGTLATDLGVEEETVRGWWRRGSIPSDHWEKLLKAAPRRRIRITPEVLVRIAART